jgi:peptidoglycan/LPS O-acetylase OafA/YrhL
MAPVSVFDVLNRNLKPYYERQGIKIFTRGGPFLIGFLFGIYYFQNKKKILNNKKYNNMLIFLSITFFFTVFVFQHCVNLNLLNRDYIFIVLIQYIFKILKYDFFVLGVLGFLLYFFINADKAGKIFRIFNNHVFLYMKKLSLTSYLIFSIMARIFFCSFEKVFNIK